MAIGMSQVEYARKMGVSRQYVSKLVKQGRIRVKNGKVYPETVTTDDGKVGKQQLAIPFAGEAGTSKGKGYWNVKTTVEEFNALLKELEYHHKMGTLVRTDEVSKAAFDVARKVRELLNTIPERLCQVLAAEDDPVVIRETLAKELNQAEEELANSFSRRIVPGSIRQGD